MRLKKAFGCNLLNVENQIGGICNVAKHDGMIIIKSMEGPPP